MNSHLPPFRINEKDEWCFTLKDFSESVRNDPELITRIEATLPRKYGIFVSCIDSEKKIICLRSDEEHTAGKLLRVLKNFGLKAKFQKQQKVPEIELNGVFVLIIFLLALGLLLFFLFT